MKNKISFLSALFLSMPLLAGAQTYVNEMIQADVEQDCYIEGGAAAFSDDGTVYYGDASYVQKSSASTPTAFIFNRDIWGNKNLTGFIVNALVPQDRDITQYVKIEYSTDEMNYHEIPDMKVEKSYDAVEGDGYWADVWMQGALPSGVKEIKVTLLAKEDDANWIPCYRRTEIFYEGGDAYEYVKPPYLLETFTSFAVDFETENYSLDMGGSENSTSSVEVVDNPKKDAVNSSDKVLKIVQDPTDPNWGWENADWFGVAIGLLSGEDNQLTEITEAEGRYLHFSVLRSENSVFGMETWNGSCTYKDQEIAFTGSENWQEIVVDLEEFIGTNFKQFYFSPNEKFGTNNVTVAETTYLDNIRISGDAGSSVESIAVSGKISVGDGVVNISGNDGECVNIYTLSGVNVGMYILENGALQVNLTPGLYIVKIGAAVEKVVVY